MELVNIHQLRPGQVVAKAVTTEAGAVLCPVGLRLTEAAISRLVDAGVRAVIVENAGVDGRRAIDRIAALRARFEGIEDPILLQLKATMEKRLNIIKLEGM